MPYSYLKSNFGSNLSSQGPCYNISESQTSTNHVQIFVTVLPGQNQARICSANYEYLNKDFSSHATTSPSVLQQEMWSFSVNNFTSPKSMLTTTPLSNEDGIISISEFFLGNSMAMIPDLFSTLRLLAMFVIYY